MENVRKQLVTYNYWHNLWNENQGLFNLKKTAMILFQHRPEQKNEEFYSDIEAIAEDAEEDSETALTSTIQRLSEENTPSILVLPELFMDTRKDLLDGLAEPTIQLDRGKKKGNGGVGRIILGPKGTGKSTFLQAYAIAANLLCDNTIIIWIDYQRLKVARPDTLLPSQFLYYAYCCFRDEFEYFEEDLTILDNVLPILKKSKKRFLIICDEFDKVFKFEDSIGPKIISQFQSLGGDTEGIFFPLISGSSSALYNLCMAHRPGMVDLAKYPSFKNISLNSGR